MATFGRIPNTSKFRIISPNIQPGQIFAAPLVSLLEQLDGWPVRSTILDNHSWSSSDDTTLSGTICISSGVGWRELTENVFCRHWPYRRKVLRSNSSWKSGPYSALKFFWVSKPLPTGREKCLNVRTFHHCQTKFSALVLNMLMTCR